MTRGSTWEYAEAVRGRYHRATKGEKGRILDEFVAVTGFHANFLQPVLKLVGKKRQGAKVHKTVLHEMGHFFGLGEEELADY